MNYYNYSGKKSQSRLKSNRKKIIINILIIVGIIALCVVFALVLGNHLKKKLEAAELSTEPVENFFEPIETEEPDPADEIDFVKNDRAEGAMSAVFGFLDLEGCPDAASAEKFVASLKEDGYTGIVFNVRNENGMYSYASKAASDLARTAPSGQVVSFDALTAALNGAAARGMRSCAYMYLGDVFLADETSSVRAAIDVSVLKELSSMGFSEIVLDGVMRDRELNIDFAKKLYAYMSSLRESCPGTDFGLVIDTTVLDDPEATPTVELIFRYVDFFALDLSNGEQYTQDAQREIAEKHGGSFGAYSILSLLGGKDIGEIRAGYAVFSGMKNPNAAFITRRSDYEEIKDESGNPVYEAKCARYTLTEPEPDDTSKNGDD